VREKLFRFTGDELPYTSTVVIDKFDEEKSKQHKRLVRIAATIVVERDGHKAMVIGDKGERLKRIGTEARQELEKLWTPRCSWSCGSRCARAGPTTKRACARSAMNEGHPPVALRALPPALESLRDGRGTLPAQRLAALAHGGSAGHGAGSSTDF
jgi:hypothetical protein